MLKIELDLPDGAMAFWAAERLLTMAQGLPVLFGELEEDGSGVAMQLQALDTREATSPGQFWMA
jgi:hypothetical protein